MRDWGDHILKSMLVHSWLSPAKTSAEGRRVKTGRFAAERGRNGVTLTREKKEPEYRVGSEHVISTRGTCKQSQLRKEITVTVRSNKGMLGGIRKNAKSRNLKKEVPRNHKGNQNTETSTGRRPPICHLRRAAGRCIAATWVKTPSQGTVADFGEKSPKIQTPPKWKHINRSVTSADGAHTKGKGRKKDQGAQNG